MKIDHNKLKLLIKNKNLPQTEDEAVQLLTDALQTLTVSKAQQSTLSQAKSRACLTSLFASCLSRRSDNQALPAAVPGPKVRPLQVLQLMFNYIDSPHVCDLAARFLNGCGARLDFMQARVLGQLHQLVGGGLARLDSSIDLIYAIKTEMAPGGSNTAAAGTMPVSPQVFVSEYGVNSPDLAHIAFSNHADLPSLLHQLKVPADAPIISALQGIGGEVQSCHLETLPEGLEDIFKQMCEEDSAAAFKNFRDLIGLLAEKASLKLEEINNILEKCLGARAVRQGPSS
jgi:hypothetical protein